MDNQDVDAQQASMIERECAACRSPVETGEAASQVCGLQRAHACVLLQCPCISLYCSRPKPNHSICMRRQLDQGVQQVVEIISPGAIQVRPS